MLSNLKFRSWEWTTGIYFWSERSPKRANPSASIKALNFKRATIKLQESFRGALGKLLESLKKASVELQEGFKRASRKLHKSFKKASKELK